MTADKSGFLAFAFFFTLCSTSVILAEDAPPKPAPAPATPKADEKPKFANPTPGQCPVTDDPIDERFTADYKGNTYAFCCNGCKKKFIADPEKYLPKK